jgi:hypothetical protein
MIKFDDFLANYMVTNEAAETRVEQPLGQYSLTDPKSQNRYPHKGDIKKIVFAAGQIAMTEEGLDEILLFDHHFVLQSRLLFDSELHNSHTLIILDFGFSEEQGEFAATLQDNSLAFWADKKERVLHSSKMHLKI